MGRKINKIEKSDLPIRKQRPEVDGQLAFEFLGQICVEKKKRGATKDSPLNGESKDAGKEATQLELPF